MQTFQIYPIPYGVTILSQKIFKYLSLFVQCKIINNNIQIRNALKRKKCSKFIFLSKKIKTSNYGEGRYSESTAEESLLPQVDPLGRPLPRPRPGPLPSL